MRLLNFIVIKLTLFIVVGILIGYFFSIPPYIIISICLFLLFILISLLTVKKRNFFESIWFGLLVFTLVTTIGVLTITLHDHKNFSNHYTKKKSVTNDSIIELQFRIREVLKPGNFYNKYVINILKINDSKASGLSLLNVSKDPANTALKVDEIIITKTQFKELISPLNPHQFDYKDYLKKKYVYHQLFLNNKQLLKVSYKKHTLFGYASWLREYINSKLKKFSIQEDELAIINALLLGQRQDISPEIYNNYTKAGAIHILAVSGLHVGIILLLLNFLLKPIEALTHGKIIKAALLILILWVFAIIAGLSASVVRAVFMFMIVAIALNLKRPTNIYNTLAISMFFLLLIKPTFLFDVGFQLSYLAVFAIVTFHPPIFSLLKPKNKVIKFFWNIFVVTIAAQFGIAPISLFYFHQFPGLFFVSNLVIIPFLGIILGIGLIVMILAVFNILPHYIALLFGKIISFLNHFVGWVASKEAFLLKDVSFNYKHVLISYSLLLLGIYVYRRKSFRSIVFLLIAILIGQSVLLIEKNIHSDSFTIFHKSRHSILGFKQNEQLTLYLNKRDSIFVNEKLIKNFKIGENIKDIKTDSIQSLYQINNQKILVVDSLAVYNVTSFKPEIVLLINSPKLNLSRLIDSLKPQLIISDGSNYKSYQDRWRATSLSKKIPFYQTSKKGSINILSLNLNPL